MDGIDATSISGLASNYDYGAMIGGVVAGFLSDQTRGSQKCHLIRLLIIWYDVFLLIIRTKCIDLYQSSHTSRASHVCLQLRAKVGHDVECFEYTTYHSIAARLMFVPW